MWRARQALKRVAVSDLERMLEPTLLKGCRPEGRRYKGRSQGAGLKPAVQEAEPSL